MAQIENLSTRHRLCGNHIQVRIIGQLVDERQAANYDPGNRTLLRYLSGLAGTTIRGFNVHDFAGTSGHQ